LLREKVRILSGVRVVGRRLKVRLEQVQTGPPLPSVVSALPTVQHPIRPVLAITASTGGPKVLLEVLGALPSDYPSGVLVTQHIPEGFSAGFATWLDSELELEVREAEEGDEIRPGRVLVAPSNAHLVVRSPFSVGLSWAEPYNSCRPSGTVMFRSLAQVCPRATIGVLLTGMGRDGADGLMDLRRAGGLCVAQDEASSLVFGMPKAAIDLGAAERILDIQGLITFLRGLA
jgi:two-component system chemotaxis response regulator CheB